MKIAIDCRMINSSGIGTHLTGILKYILKEDGKFLLIGDRKKLSKYEANNIEIFEYDEGIFSIKELLFFPTKKINECDAFFSAYYNIPFGIKVPVYSIIHDVVFLDMPEIIDSSIGRLIRKLFLYRGVKKSKVVFTDSDFSKKRIEYYFPNDKTIVGYCGINPKIADFIEEVKKEERIIKDDYIVFVGNVKKHKGIKTLLLAFIKALENGFNKKLIIVGSRDKFKSKDEEIGILLDSNKDRGVECTGYISDKEVYNIIYNADILIQPSFYEGFGLPPLEALSCGTNILISDIDVFKEIYSEYTNNFFKVGDVEDLAKKLVEFDLKKEIEESISAKIEKRFSYKSTSKLIYKTITQNLK